MKRRIAIYFSALILSNLVAVVAVPLVIGSVGAETWGGLAVSQTLASIVSTIALFGWGATGPTLVAGSAPVDRARIISDSVPPRVFLCVALLPVLVALILLTAKGDPVVDVTVGVSGLLAGLGATWFLVGEGSSLRVLLLDALPRSAATVVGVGVLIHTQTLLWYGVCQILGASSAVILCTASIVRRYESPRPDWSPGKSLLVLRGQVHGVSTSAGSMLYASTPLVVVSILLPGGVPTYAIADRLLKLALTGFSPFVQTSQAALGVRQGLEARAKRLTLLASVAGVIAGILLSVLMPFGARLLSAGRVEVTVVLAIALGLACCFVCVSSVVGLGVLASLGSMRSVALSTGWGAVVGVPLILILAWLNGVEGVAIALAISEGVVLAVQLLALSNLLTHERRS